MNLIALNMDSQIETYKDYIISLDPLFYRINSWRECGLNEIVPPPYIYRKGIRTLL